MTVVVASSSDPNVTISNCAIQLSRVALTTSYPLQIILSPRQHCTVASGNRLAKDRLANDHITTDDPTAASPSQHCAIIAVDCLITVNGLTDANGLATINGPTIVRHTDNQLAPIEQTMAPIEPTTAPIKPMMRSWLDPIRPSGLRQ
jgi:hypothetical protein